MKWLACDKAVARCRRSPATQANFPRRPREELAPSSSHSQLSRRPQRKKENCSPENSVSAEDPGSLYCMLVGETNKIGLERIGSDFCADWATDAARRARSLNGRYRVRRQRRTPPLLAKCRPSSDSDHLRQSRDLILDFCLNLNFEHFTPSAAPNITRDSTGTGKAKPKESSDNNNSSDPLICSGESKTSNLFNREDFGTQSMYNLRETSAANAAHGKFWVNTLSQILESPEQCEMNSSARYRKLGGSDIGRLPKDEIVEEERGFGGDKERAGFAADQDPITDVRQQRTSLESESYCSLGPYSPHASSLQTKVLNIGDRRIRAHETQIDGRRHDHSRRSISSDLEALIIALGSARAELVGVRSFEHLTLNADGGHPEFQIPPHPALVGAW
ncbi:hypothetical protein C8R44DRAFT_748436 [Mycena epipterygia]|nr:hypothetical protein C8R44DRAFT_748436 [Mycena epipterygia]